MLGVASTTILLSSLKINLYSISWISMKMNWQNWTCELCTFFNCNGVLILNGSYMYIHSYSM